MGEVGAEEGSQGLCRMDSEMTLLDQIDGILAALVFALMLVEMVRGLKF